MSATERDERDDRDGGAELPPALAGALAGLPREREASRLLEERTVRALRERGLLPPPRRERLRIPMPWRVAGAAAALALFAGGFGAGGWAAGRDAARAVEAERARGEAHAAALVRETGQAYVAALSALAAQRGDSAQAARGRAAAQEALHAAASQVVRLSPDDAVASGILTGFDRARQEGAPDTAATRKVVWF